MESTFALFDELSTGDAASSTGLREALLARPDLLEVLRQVLLGRVPAPVAPSEVLRKHREVLRARCAAELLGGLDARVAMPVALEVSREAAGEGRFVVKKVAHTLLEREPSLWSAVLDPANGLDTIRYCVARIRRDAQEDTARPGLERLARLGLALDLIVPLLAVDDAGLAVVREALTDASISGDARAHAFGTIRYSPGAWELARSIVRAGSHTSASLVKSLVYAYQDAGVDVAFERGDGLRARSQQDVADVLRAWEREADAVKPVRLGFVPMHRGVEVTRDGVWTLYGARNQVFVAGGKRCWQVRYERYDIDDDPNEVTRLESLPPEERIDASQLRPGAYLRAEVTLSLERVEPSHAHPFAEAAPPEPLPVRWWRGTAGPVRFALLPLHGGEGTGERPLAYAWRMPWSDSSVYGIVLAGEKMLDAAVERREKVSVALTIPLVTHADEKIYDAVVMATTSS